jgi:hypothetical protein
MAVTMKISVFWDVRPCNQKVINVLEESAASIFTYSFVTLKIEAVGFYLSTRRQSCSLPCPQKPTCGPYPEPD